MTSARHNHRKHTEVIDFASKQSIGL